MKDTQEELERIQTELLAEETVSLEELLDDQELNHLLWEENNEEAPEGEEPETAGEPETFRNFANGYGADEEEPAKPPRTTRDDKVLIGLMATASVLCLGIIGVLAYWLTVLL